MITATSNQPTPAIAIHQLRFDWHPQQPLLNIPTLTVPRGEHLFLYGPSGSGKTTLLNLLAGVMHPQSGRVELMGCDMAKLSVRRRDRYRANHIGVIFQQFNLIPYLSVLDNILLAAHFADRQTAAELHQRATELLTQLELPEELHQRPATALSVGQQQRVAVARALICQPELLIADEPTSALDSDTRDRFLKLLFSAAEQSGSTVIFVSHDRALQSQFHRALDIRSLS